MASTKQIKFFQYKFYTNPAWVERGIVALFERQTNDEQIVENSRHDNDRGFNKPDSKIMSQWAKEIISGQHLKDSELKLARKRLMKYAGQLAKIANYKYYQKKNAEEKNNVR